MKRVLLITDIFPPEIGGPATFIDRLAHALTDRGTRVTVICTTPDPDMTDRQRPFRVQRILRTGRIPFGLRMRARLVREMLRHRQILVNGLESLAGETAAQIGRRYVLKIVGDYVWEIARNTGQTHLGIDAFQHNVPPSLAALARQRQQYLSQASTLITPSRYLQQLVAGWGVPSAQIHVVFNGVELAHFQQYGPRQRDAHEPLRAVFCGRLTNWKGVETLLLAMQQLEGVELTIVGGGPEAPLLRSLAEQLDLGPAVRFAGVLPRERMHVEMSHHDVAVLTSGYEGLSHTLLEAAGLGLPMVASDCCGNPEVVDHEVNGLLVPFAGVREVREAFIRLRDDESLRYRLAQQAKGTSSNFDFSTTVARTAELLTQPSLSQPESAR